MITVKQHEKLIDRITGLSELELDQLLKDIGQHLYKNNLEHLIDNAFQMDDQTEEIERLEEEVDNLENKLDDLKNRLDEIWRIADHDDIEEGDEGALRKIIEDINNKAA